jgi:NAD(P)H-flavin reductase
MKKYRLLDIEHLTNHTFRLRVERPDISIKAGQWFSLGLPGRGINREYSLYSGADDPYLEFLIRSVENGLVSVNLQEARTNDLIEIDGPYGDFCLTEPIDPKKRHLLVATGTGIAPFHSFVATYPELSCSILHGIRGEHECYHAEDYNGVNYRTCISRPANGNTGQRVTNILADHVTPPDAVVYLCGNRSMITDAFKLFHEQGVCGNQINAEVFF